LEGFDHFILRDKFGPGKYRGRLFDNAYHYVKQGGPIEFEFTAPLPTAAKEEKEADPLQSPIVALMIESAKNQNAMLMEILKSALPAQAQASAGKGAEIITLIEALHKLNSLSPKDTGIKSIEDSLRLTKLIRDSFDEGGKEKEGSVLSEIRELLELAPVLKEQFGKSLPGGNISPGALTPTPAAPARRFFARNPEPTENGKKHPLWDAIAPHIPEFEEAARTNQPAAKWADYFLELLEEKIMPVLLPLVQEEYKSAPLTITEDTIYDNLIDRASKPEEVAKLFEWAPALAPYESWVRAVIEEAVRLETSEESLPEPSSGPEPSLEG
jgi:hypothetical protein